MSKEGNTRQKPKPVGGECLAESWLQLWFEGSWKEKLLMHCQWLSRREVYKSVVMVGTNTSCRILQSTPWPGESRGSYWGGLTNILRCSLEVRIAGKGSHEFWGCSYFGVRSDGQVPLESQRCKESPKLEKDDETYFFFLVRFFETGLLYNNPGCPGTPPL